MCLCVELRENGASLKHIVNVLNHNPLNVLKLIIYCVYVSSSICQRFLGFLYVNVELNELIWPGDGVDLSAVIVVKLLSKILKIVEGDALGKHFITQHQVANFIFDKVTKRRFREMSSEL